MLILFAKLFVNFRQKTKIFEDSFINRRYQLQKAMPLFQKDGKICMTRIREVESSIHLLPERCWIYFIKFSKADRMSMQSVGEKEDIIPNARIVGTISVRFSVAKAGSA